MPRCRSCGAEIEWATTTNGTRIPVDPGPAADGNLVVKQGIAWIVGPGKGDRISHFATCPSAGQHRRPRAKAAP